MKNKIMVLGITLLTGMSNAFAMPDRTFYAALDAGIIEANFNNQFTDLTDVIPLNIAQTAEQHGYTGGITFGYRSKIRESYFGGGEVSFNMDGNTAVFESGASTTAFTDKVQLQGHIDLVGKLGTFVTDTFEAYLKFGLSYGFVQDNLSSPGGFLAVMTAYSDHKGALGVTAGLGLAKALTTHTSLFTEINYHDFGTIDFKNFQNFSATYSHSTHLYAYDATLGIAYAFS